MIRSQKAETNQANQNKIYMTGVKAIFYFKNNKNLIIDSNSGIYNNKTLDMIFKENIKASFDKSVLYANSAEYSNLKEVLGIDRIIDPRMITASQILKHVHKGKIESVYSISNNQGEIIHATQFLKFHIFLYKKPENLHLLSQQPELICKEENLL